MFYPLHQKKRGDAGEWVLMGSGGGGRWAAVVEVGIVEGKLEALLEVTGKGLGGGGECRRR